jgi:hypothetical protein
LELNSQVNADKDARLILESQLRECYGCVVYAHKTQEKCADILLLRLSRIKFWQLLLSAITTAGFIGVILGKDVLSAVVGVSVSTALLILNAYIKNYDLGELAQKHKQAANDLWLTREKYLSLLTDISSMAVSLESLRTQRDLLLEQLHTVYSGAPCTTFRAYKKAQEALKRLGDMSFSDEEIDAFLPTELRRSSK